MARRTISVEILGDYSSLQKSFKGASGSAKTFDRDLGKSARGAIAAAVSFRGLGRSIAFASSYFLGGAGIVYALRKGVEGAESLEKAQRSLAVVVDKNGGSFRQQLPIINAWAAAQARFGISTVQAEQGLARASVITGSATKGMRAYTEALEISKATGKSFSAVLLAAAKANEGQTTALARYIGKLPKGISGQKLFNAVQAKYAGQAQANTIATDKLGAALTNIETLVGNALLPTINRYSNELAKWLGQSQNQERVQRDVASAVHALSSVLSTLRSIVSGVDKVTGSFKNTLELLLGMKVASVALKWAGAMNLFAASETRVAESAVVSRISAYTGAVSATGTAAEVSAAKVGLLQKSLLGMSALSIAPILIPIEFAVGHKERAFLDKYGGKLGGLGKALLDVATAGGAITGGNIITDLTGIGRDKKKGKENPGLSATSGLGPHHAPPPAASTPGATTTPKPNKPLSLQGQLNLAELHVAQAATTKGSQDDLAALRAKAAILQAMIAKGGTLKEQTQRNQDLGSTLDQIQSILTSGAQTNKKKAATAKKAWGDYLKSLKNRVSAAGLTKGVGDDIAALKAEIAAIKEHERKVGKTPELEAQRIAAEKQLLAANKKKPILNFAIPFKLQLADLKAQTTKTTSDDLKIAEAQKAFARKMIKSGKLRGQALLDAWQAIIDANTKIADLQNSQTRQVAAVSTKFLTAGLNLTHAQTLALRQRFAQAEAHPGMDPGQIAANGIVINGDLNLHGVNDAKTLANELTKRAKRNSGQSRGTRPGAYLGHH